jgi:ABC-type Zn uptake system ZnuABC Zn-binding protein ZnuA
LLASLTLCCGLRRHGITHDGEPPRAASLPAQDSVRLPARPPTEHELPIRIAVTLPIFEEFTRVGGGDNVDVISLIPPDADPHSYTLTDTEALKGIDFFFLNGLGLDSRFRDVIESNRDEVSYVIPFAPNTLSPWKRPDGRTGG